MVQMEKAFYLILNHIHSEKRQTHQNLDGIPMQSEYLMKYTYLQNNGDGNKENHLTCNVVRNKVINHKINTQQINGSVVSLMSNKNGNYQCII